MDYSVLVANLCYKLLAFHNSHFWHQFKKL